MIDVLRCYVKARKFRLQDFVIMPDHVHLFRVSGEEKGRRGLKRVPQEGQITSGGRTHSNS